MNTRVLILALLVLAAGCSSTTPVQPALAPPEPPQPPNVAAPEPDPGPPATTPPAPDDGAPSAPVPPPKASAPAAVPPAPPAEKRRPIITSRVANEEEITRAVNTRLAKVSTMVDRIDPSKLTRDQRELFASLQDFVSKTKEALRTRDLAQAQILVEKALGLADNLAPR